MFIKDLGERESPKDDDDNGPSKKKKKKAQQVQHDAVKEETEEQEDEDIGRFVMAPPDPATIDFSQELPEWQYYNLQNELLEAIYENRFTKPTEIQRLTLAPAIMGRRDILGAAETGSGKTLAFGIPILNGILHLKEQMANNNTVSIRKGGKCNIKKFELAVLTFLSFSQANCHPGRGIRSSR